MQYVKKNEVEINGRNEKEIGHIQDGDEEGKVGKRRNIKLKKM